MAKRDFNVDIDLNNNDLLNVDSVALNTSTSDGGGVGKIWWNTDHETANIGLDAHVTLQVGQEHVVRVKNASGSTAIPNFTFVMFAGATGDTITVSPAVTDGTVDHQYMVGITTEDIPADGFGFVTQIGFINNVDTSDYTLGQLLYPNPSVAGGFTTTQPSAPAFDLPVAAVTRVNENSGRVLVRMSNGLRLKDLHDVQITSPADNEVLAYDSASGTWINQTAVEAGLIDTSSTAQTKSGDLTLNGELTAAKLKATSPGGDEGGEINLAKAVTNTTLVDGVIIDVYQNKLRFFESGGTNRGAYIDLSGTATSVGTNLVGGGSASNSFTTISTPSGTSPVADSSTDTLTLLAGTGITITGDSSADSITIASTVTDTNTTYDLTSTGTTTASINLVPSSGGTDSVTITGSGATSVSHSAGAITISSTDTNTTYTAGTGLTLTGTTFSVTANTYQPLDSDLTAIAGLASTAGFLKKVTDGTWSIDTNSYVAGVGTSKISYQTTAPSSPTTGDIWIDSDATVDTFSEHLNKIYTPTSGSYLHSGAAVSTSWLTGTGFMKSRKIFVPETLTFDEITCSVTGAGSTGAVVRLGIYSCKEDGTPDSLILDAGTVSTTVTGPRAISINQTLSPGVYWLVAVGQTVQSTLRADNGTGHWYYQSSFATADMDCFEQSGVTGALPSTFTGTNMRSSAPRIMLRVA